MLDGYRYRGRHRTPSTAGRTTGRVIVAGVVAAAPFVMAPAASADPLDAIEQCESGGKNVQNATSSASGYFQIIDSTWAAYGGKEFAPTAQDATAAEQHIVAERLLAAQGTAPWNASKSCWAGKASAPKHAAPEVKPEAKPAPVKPKPAPTAKHRAVEPVALATPIVPATSRYTAGGTGSYVVKSGDTLSGIAAAHHLPGGWQALAAANTGIVEDAHWIFPGERLAV